MEGGKGAYRNCVVLFLRKKTQSQFFDGECFVINVITHAAECSTAKVSLLF